MELRRTHFWHSAYVIEETLDDKGRKSHCRYLFINCYAFVARFIYSSTQFGVLYLFIVSAAPDKTTQRWDDGKTSEQLRHLLLVPFFVTTLSFYHIISMHSQHDSFSHNHRICCCRRPSFYGNLLSASTFFLLQTKTTHFSANRRLDNDAISTSWFNRVDDVIPRQ